MKLLRTTRIDRDIRCPEDIVNNDAVMFAQFPVAMNAGDEIAVYTDFTIYEQDVNARFVMPQVKAILEGGGGYKVKAYHVGADIMSPGALMFVLRSKETVSA